MSDPKLISPLLDGFAMGSPISEHDGVVCCPAMKENSDNRYIVKIISIPASQVQLEALLVTGAYQDPADAMDYFKEQTDNVEKEAQLLKKLSRLEGFLAYDAWQVDSMDDNRLGYTVYLIGSYKRSLEKYMRKHSMTHLGTVNLGLDLCAALAIARRAGYLYVDLKPSNVFISGDKEYRIGDLGFQDLASLKYATLPSKYCSDYTAPEMRDALGTVNTTADTYALGMILYQIYNNGILPVVDPESEDPLPFPVNADYEMAEIILKACAPKKELRYADPAQMGQALVAYMQRNRVSNTPISPVVEEVKILPETPILEEIREIPDESEPSEEDATQADLQTVSEEASVILEQADILMSEDIVLEEASAETEESADKPEETPLEESPEVIAELETESVIQETIPEVSEESAFVPEAEETTEIPVSEILPDEEVLNAEDFLSMGDPKEETPVRPEKPKKDKKKKSKKKGKKKKKKKSKTGLILTILVLLLTIMGVCGYYYYDNFYLQTIHAIQVEGSGDEMTVILDTQADNSLLTVLITDTYGNTQKSPVAQNRASFSGLLPGTLYKIRVEIDGFHDLHPKGVASHGYTTDAQTKIVSLTAKTGNEDGSVVLNFAVEGASPESWIVRYTHEGEEMTQEFTGRMTTVSGLNLDTEYTFTLEPQGGLILVGEDSISFTTSRILVAENLQVLAYANDTLTATWDAPEGAEIENWTVRCYSDDGFDQSLTTQDTTASFSGIDSTKPYTLEVLAAGMTNPARISITANPYNVSSILVDDSDPSKLTVSWVSEGTTPENGWVLKYTVDDSLNQGVAVCNGNSAVVQPRIPGAKYVFSVESSDGHSVFGGKHSYHCPNASIFEAQDLLVTKDHINRKLTVNMLPTPETENWTGANVTSKDFTSTLKSGQKGSLLLHLNTNFYIRELDVNVLYVIRNSDGNVMTDHISEVKTDWSALWYQDDYQTCELDIPSLPKQPGDYTLYVYFNQGAITTVHFTISE